MLLLSSLLGPAKPPVASREDVASAPGLYRITGSPELLLAQAFNGPGIIQIAPGERCLVCLCDYETEEEVRQLTKCSHLFHRECIDEVSYTHSASRLERRNSRKLTLALSYSG